MKATAIALIIVGGYWVAKGVEAFSQDQSKGLVFIALGIALVPLAKYFWRKKLPGSRPDQE